MYKIFDIDPEEVGVIEELWESNRIFHQKISRHFKELYTSITFEERMQNLRNRSREEIKVTVAQRDGRYIGYCISKITGGKGELESLHVTEESRGLGVGKTLSSKHLEWMKGRGCSSIGVRVAYENDDAISFYRKLGFFPNTLCLQLK
ncbi:N-acetyltransferase [Propionigenium maris DSM 9537]|uniref:N-acetyltransferase n=1 Tax=Propionigenium maris DSM 9537 TaxID=1123000 RepID=A0A9W6GJD5_9FUSO|nr:GNAT family N-acetyltransferase [Propionigenium maris]GLI54959.1 N-acetyltransferase [Propionigenium maris DSM 9537]